MSLLRLSAATLVAIISFHPLSWSSELGGKVLIGGKAVAGAAVRLWQTAGRNPPAELAQATTDGAGSFSFHDAPDVSGGNVFYLTSASGPDNRVALLSVLGERLPATAIVNELTTVASAYTSARFIDGFALSGDALGLRIAAGNAPNLVDPTTGGWGKVLLDPLNSTQTTTLANLDTLGSLLTAFATTADQTWRARFLAAATPSGGNVPADSLAAIAGIAREPWAHPGELFALFEAAYPQPKDGSRRAAPFVPYLDWTPPDFALSLCFAGGGMFANGRFMFDAEGNLWSGQNWLPGSQSGVRKSIGGGVIKFSPSGSALSPPITGFTGMGIDGVGWGTAVTVDKVWITSFNGRILVMDLAGKPLGQESDFAFAGKVSGLMGVGLAANGDVWIADGSDDQLLFFPAGRAKDGKIVKVAGLKSPFDIVIDDQNMVWVANSSSDTVVRFPANDPTKTQTFQTGLSVRGLALDSKSNVWVSNLLSLDFPAPKIPDGASIMEQFGLLAGAALNYPKPTGVITMIRPDGTMPMPKGFTGGGAVDIPWGLKVDGNDDIWVANLSPRTRAVVLLAGDGSKGHPPGIKTGDVIHKFQSGSIQMLTDVAIDPAGNVWAANNWNDPDAAVGNPPVNATSTWGGGSGLTVIYGVAAPVKTPRIGKVRPN